MNKDIDGYTKSACLLFFLGIKKSIEILKHFNLNDKKKIILKLSDASTLSKKNIDISIKCYKEHYKNLFFNKKKYFNIYFESIINKSFDKKDNLFLIDNIKNKKKFFKNIKKINSNDAKYCYLILKKEHPQIISIFLKYLNKNKSFKILSFFKKNYKYEIIKRMFNNKKLNKFSENEFFKIINSIFKKKKIKKKYNFNEAIKIFNLFSKKEKIFMLKNCFKKNNSIRKKIICEMLSFEDIFNINDNNIYILLKYVKKKILCMSIKNLEEKFKNKILANMSKRQLYYFFEIIKDSNLKISDLDIKNSRNSILHTLKILLKKNILILEDIEKIYA
ncbi:FliG C-terminal domain-containing protein [Buchnera aphidicola (Pseudoregma panicola)]|uniref:FliG C-terminal domain-containing protein n=1 Tax=Buchnera aphidicola TaxID=9 RepID=UPI0031B6FD78